MPYLNDEIAIQQAKKYGLEKEYLEARRHGCSIIEALEEWDLVDEFLLEIAQHSSSDPASHYK